MVTLADGQSGSGGGGSSEGGGGGGGARSVSGDMLCLLSAVLYGGYTVAIRWAACGLEAMLWCASFCVGHAVMCCACAVARRPSPSPQEGAAGG